MENIAPGLFLGIPENEHYPATWMAQRLIQQINSFIDQLDKDHQVGMIVQNNLLLIESVEPSEPNLIIFHGKLFQNDLFQNCVSKNNLQPGWKTQLVVDIHQVNLLLVAVPKMDSDVHHQIGFQASTND